MSLCRFSGPSLIEYLDGLPAVNRMTEGPVRIPILDRYKVRIPILDRYKVRIPILDRYKVQFLLFRIVHANERFLFKNNRCQGTFLSRNVGNINVKFGSVRVDFSLFTCDTVFG